MVSFPAIGKNTRLDYLLDDQGWLYTVRASSWCEKTSSLPQERRLTYTPELF